MYTPAQCQISFQDVFDDVAQSEAAIFIVSMTALMKSHPFCQRCLEVVESSELPLDVDTCREPKLCVQRNLLTLHVSQNCLLMWS